MAHQDSSRPFFDPLINRLIRDSARRVIASTNLPRAEIPDIEQDLRLHLWTQRDAYRAERGARSTFAKVVIRRKATAMAIRYRAQRRFATHVPIDGFLDTTNDESDQPVGRPIPGITSPTAIIESFNRRIAIRRAIQRLTGPDRGIAKQLMAARVSEIASEAGIPRSTIYESIKRIRRQLIDSGLDPEPCAIPTIRRSSE